jgi:hypothetical protein
LSASIEGPNILGTADFGWGNVDAGRGLKKGEGFATIEGPKEDTI